MNMLKEMVCRGGKVSNTKVWNLVANLLVCLVVVKTHLVGEMFNPEFLWGFLCIVGGVNLTSKWMEKPPAAGDVSADRTI